MNATHPQSKTIFIDLFAVTSLPILTLPGGVLDQLSHKKLVRLVLLIPDDPVFFSAVQPYLNDHIIVERIKKYFPETFLQKLFVFFYSYLIFTSTTRLLATFGARADAPPAGGNRRMAPVKSAIANTFGRSSWIKTKLVPTLYKRIFNERHYRYLFERHHPDLVFTANIAFNPGIEFMAEAGRQGVKTIALPANWDHLNKYYIPIHADHLLVQNQPMAEEAVEYHAYEPRQIKVVGFPQFDVYRNEDFFMSRDSYLKHFDIPSDSKIILFISGSVYAQDEPDILAEIVRWIKEGKLPKESVLMIRPYVGMRSRAHEEIKYARLKSEPRVFFNWEVNNHQMENRRIFNSMLRYADIVISVFSTTAIEAVIFDKPTIVLGFDGYTERPEHQSVRRLEKLSHFKHILDTGSVSIARGFDNLRRLLDDSLRRPERDHDRRQLLVPKMCHRIDGRSSERIVNALISLLYAL